jgi:dihydroorotate dehydrogenase electron transfer subunit
LGNGFDLDAIVSGCSPSTASGAASAEHRRLVIVAGGVGVAPFPLFLSRLAERKAAVAGCLEVVALLGFRDGSQAEGAVPVEAAVTRLTESGLSCRLAVASEDGSLGPAQKVTDLLEAELRPGDQVVVCGPPAMSVAVWRICSTVADVRTWFSLEANMACGVGSCHGCAIALADGSFARVCREGPVFPGKMVFGAHPAHLGGGKEPV